MEIIKAEKENAEVVGQIHSKAWKQTYTDVFPSEYLTEDTPKKRAQEFLDTCTNENVLFFLICEDEKAIGIAKLEEDVDSVEIVSLYILEEYRNNGFGKQMLAYINSLWKTKDIRLWVLKDNLKARNFYEKNGFVSTGFERTIWRGNTYEQLQYEYSHGKI